MVQAAPHNAALRMCSLPNCDKSTNWAAYFVRPLPAYPGKLFSEVVGTWEQPPVTCPFAPTVTGKADGVVTMNVNGVVSPSLFADNKDYVDYTITDSLGLIPRGTVIAAERNAINQVFLSNNANGNAVNDVFTLTPPLPDMAPWVGIDGVDTNTVEQAGTEAVCTGGKYPTYSAWWEMHGPFDSGIQLFAITVRPNNLIRATVTYATTAANPAGIWTLTVTNVTLHETGTVNVPVGPTLNRSYGCAYTGMANPPCGRANAEWVVERTGLNLSGVFLNGCPAGYVCSTNKPLAHWLARLGSNMRLGGAKAALDGLQLMPIPAFTSAAPSPVPLWMTNQEGNMYLATVSGLRANKNGSWFTIKWKGVGP